MTAMFHPWLWKPLYGEPVEVSPPFNSIGLPPQPFTVKFREGAADCWVHLTAEQLTELRDKCDAALRSAEPAAEVAAASTEAAIAP